MEAREIMLEIEEGRDIPDSVKIAGASMIGELIRLILTALLKRQTKLKELDRRVTELEQYFKPKPLSEQL